MGGGGCLFATIANSCTYRFVLFCYRIQYLPVGVALVGAFVVAPFTCGPVIMLKDAVKA